MAISQDYLHFPPEATVDEVLQVYQGRDCHYWWLLITNDEEGYAVCSFGSLLPYLTGRTMHIVHNIGDCVICSAMDPLLWRDTGALVEEALANEDICARRVGDLPLAELCVEEMAATEEPGFYGRLWAAGHRVCALTENGALCGMYVMQMLSPWQGSIPDL